MKHVGVIECGFIEPGHSASCNCGFTGKVRPTEEQAEDDLADHYRAVAEKSLG